MEVRDTIYSTIILTLALVWATCCPAVERPPQAPPVRKCECVVCECDVCNCAHFGEVKAEPVRIVLFTAEWCLPCQKMHPSWRKVSAENPGLLAEYDFDLNEEWARSLGVRVLPQVLVLRGEKVVERASIGAKSETQIRMLVEKWRGE